jgi:hypothetical protein
MRPKRGDLAFSAGNALKDIGDIEEALKFFELALKAEPTNPKYLFSVALCQRVCFSFFRIAEAGFFLHKYALFVLSPG